MLLVWYDMTTYLTSWYQGVVLQWFRSYLVNHNQYVYVNGTISDVVEVFTGVLKGVLLGPVLFLMYI